MCWSLARRAEGPYPELRLATLGNRPKSSTRKSQYQRRPARAHSANLPSLRIATSSRHWFASTVRAREALTGLKPAGSVEPGIEAADKALDKGSGAALATELAQSVSEGVRRRFDATFAHKKHAGDSVDAGHKYVEAYVDYVHLSRARTVLRSMVRLMFTQSDRGHGSRRLAVTACLPLHFRDQRLDLLAATGVGHFAAGPRRR
jgi:hypothetical protein